jgi:general stress protein 26
MATPQELEKKFWKALKDDMTMMLGVDGIEDGHTRPMTALFSNDTGPIFFFTTKDNALVQALDRSKRVIASFASKDHGLFASVHGTLSVDHDRSHVDEHWNRFVAAWYEGGKDDPKLALLRLDPEEAQIWLNDSSVFAGIKLLLGKDPKKEYRDKVAEVPLG